MVKVYVSPETRALCCPVSHWAGARRRAELLQGVIPINAEGNFRDYQVSPMRFDRWLRNVQVHK